HRNTISHVLPHSSLAYYGMVPRGCAPAKKDEGSGMMEDISEHTLELRVSRYVGRGMHEDLDLTNFTQAPTTFELTLEVHADFADLSELHSRKQKGQLRRSWKQDGEGRWDLTFDYRAEHHYKHQG